MASRFTQTGAELRLLAAVLVLIAVMPARAAPVGPAEVLKSLHLQDEAVERIGYRLAAANADLCPGGADAGAKIGVGGG